MLISYKKLDRPAFWDFDGKTTFWYTITYVKYTWWGLFERTFTKETFTRSYTWKNIETQLEQKLNKWIK